MKSLAKIKKELGLWQQEAPVPEIGSNDVLIKIKKTAICGTDLHIYNWDAWAQKTIPAPMIATERILMSLPSGKARTAVSSFASFRTTPVSGDKAL